MNRRDYITQTGLLLGYTLSIGTVSAIMTSCKNENTTAKSTSLITSTQMDLLSSICDTILPKTDSPGALDTHCPAFIVKLVEGVFKKDDQAAFVKGIDDLEADCKKTNGKGFLQCNKIEKEKFLTKLDTESAQFRPVMWGIVLGKQEEPITFFRKVKAMTLMAHFTSKEWSDYDKSVKG